jgi:DedD protein
MPAPEPKSTERRRCHNQGEPRTHCRQTGCAACCRIGRRSPSSALAEKSGGNGKESCSHAAKPGIEPKPAAETKPADEASGQWVVQLGAYKEAGNVKLLLAKLKGVNVPAYTEKFDSPQGPRTRVRAGPFATQEAAEKARARIKIIGVDGPVAQK